MKYTGLRHYSIGTSGFPDTYEQFVAMLADNDIDVAETSLTPTNFVNYRAAHHKVVALLSHDGHDGNVRWMHNFVAKEKTGNTIHLEVHYDGSEPSEPAPLGQAFSYGQVWICTHIQLKLQDLTGWML